jgi:hypothetical protein
MRKQLFGLGLGVLVGCTGPIGGGANPSAPGVSLGTAQGAAVCSGDLAEQTFRYGLCVCGDLDMAGALRTSSLRPSTGAAGEAGGVGVNGRYLSAGDARIGGSLVVGGEVAPIGNYEISGELRAGGDVTAIGDIDVERDAWVQGELTAIGLSVEGTLHTTEAPRAFWVDADDRVIEDFTVDAPCGCDDDVPVAEFVEQAATDNDNGAAGLDASSLDLAIGHGHIQLPPGRYYFDDITTIGDFHFELSGPTAIYIDDDLELAGVLRIELETPEAELDLFINGNIASAGVLEIGSVDRPHDVRVYLAGEGDIAMAGVLDLGAAIWAPNARLAAAGDLEYTGAMLVGSVRDAGRIVAVYDADLSDEGESCDDGVPVDDPVQPEEPDLGGGGDDCGQSFDCPDPQVCIEGACVLIEG